MTVDTQTATVGTADLTFTGTKPDELSTREEKTMMKVMDWYMRQFIEYEAMPDKDKPILIKVPYGTYEYVKLYFQYGCEGGYDYQFKSVGISLEDLKEAVEKKLMKHKEYSSWEARQRGMTDYYSITIKGIKAIYNEMNAQ